MNNAKYKVYKYGALPWIGLILSMALMALGIFLLIRIMKSPWPVDALFFIVGIPWFAAFVVLPLIAYRDVVILDKGIGRRFYGLCFPIVPWEKIVGIRCGSISSDQSVKAYHLQTKLGSPFGGVRIVSIIDEAETLESAIDTEVKRREIPIFGWDANKLIKLDRLPPLSKGRAGWK